MRWIHHPGLGLRQAESIKYADIAPAEEFAHISLMCRAGRSQLEPLFRETRACWAAEHCCCHGHWLSLCCAQSKWMQVSCSMQGFQAVGSFLKSKQPMALRFQSRLCKDEKEPLIYLVKGLFAVKGLLKCSSEISSRKHIHYTMWNIKPGS